MSTISVTTTTVNYDAGNDAEGRDSGNYANHGQSQQRNADAHDINSQGGRNGGNDSIGDALNSMNIPDALKEFLRKALGVPDGERLPSQLSALDTIKNFQNTHRDKLGLISYDDMQSMANGAAEINGVKVPADVQAAAKTYMADGGAMFNKVESAYNGKHDSKLSATDADYVDRSQLSNRPTVDGIRSDSFLNARKDGHITKDDPEEYNAVKTVDKFMKDNELGGISRWDMQQMASGMKELNGFKVPEEVTQAAKIFMQDNGALFDKIDPAADGTRNGELEVSDVDAAVKKGLVKAPPMSADDAVSTMEQFQKNGGPKLITKDEMEGIASGKLTHYNGKELSPEVKAAAKTYVADHDALFKRIESATDGKHDGKLGAGDPEHARAKGLVGMSDEQAVDTIANMQRGPGSKISKAEMKEMAVYGTFDGQKVSSDRQLAAQNYMRNGGKLFDEVESSTNDEHDGLLGRGDAKNWKKRHLDA